MNFNKDFQKILIEKPSISIEEQNDCCKRYLEAYIWKNLCTKNYENLAEKMRGAERVDSAHCRDVTATSDGNRPQSAVVL